MNPTRIVLRNGASIIVKETRRSPAVAISLAVRGGNLDRQMVDLGLDIAFHGRLLLRHRIENAAILADARQALFTRRAVAEHQLEDDARVVLHRQRRGRRAPGDRVVVGAAEPVGTVADHVGGFQGELDGPDLRVLLELTRDDLIHRHAEADVRTIRLLRV